jgi:hypothetical protein
MTAAAQLAPAPPPALTGAFRTPPASDGIHPTEATRNLVRSQVQALLDETDSYHALPDDDRQQISDRLTHIAAYAAECMRDICWQSERLGQRPVLRTREVVSAPLARQARSSRSGPPQPTGPVGRVAQVTKDTLRAVAFPVFVADLIKGTFNAIIQSNIQQMEQFGKLLENVMKSVDQFMADNITDEQARDWLQASYHDHIKVSGGKAVAADGADEKAQPDWERELNLPGGISLDDDTIEEQLVPAARRRLAENRLQMLSTMVLMGVNRIVVTGGKIRATMAFHIDASERTHEEHATDFDFRTAAAGSFGWGPWSVSASTSVSYVNSSRSSNDGEINVSTDLTGEVEIHFKSDYFPVERFATPGKVGQIQANTPNPAGNPLGDTPPVGPTVQAPAPPPHTKPVTTLPPISMPPPGEKTPVKPTEPDVKRHVPAPKGSKWAEPSPDDQGSGEDKAADKDKAPAADKTPDKDKAPAADKKPDKAPDKAPDKKKDAKPAADKAKPEPETIAEALWAPSGSYHDPADYNQNYWREVLR